MKRREDIVIASKDGWVLWEEKVVFLKKKPVKV